MARVKKKRKEKERKEMYGGKTPRTLHNHTLTKREAGRAQFARFMEQQYPSKYGYDYAKFWGDKTAQVAVELSVDASLAFTGFPFVSKESLLRQKARKLCFLAILPCPKMRCYLCTKGCTSNYARHYCLKCGPLCAECKKRTHISSSFSISSSSSGRNV